MIVNKSMFPVQTGFGVISKMQDKFATLQMQLGTGEKASKLSEMGRDLPLSLSVRSRLGSIEGFSANIDTVNLRLSFLDKTMTRLDKIEGEARNSAVQGQYGTNNINMATLPGLSYASLDELVTLLNSDVAGRYLFGGSNTDSAPLPETDVLLNGQGGKAGYNTVLGERKAADAGPSGMGRLMSSIGAIPNNTTINLTEDGIHPFGLKLSNVFSNAGSAVELGAVAASATAVPQRGDTLTVKFSADPTQQMLPGQTITMGFVLPDGLETQLVMTAIAPEDAPAAPGQFVVTNDPVANAASFQTALDSELKSVVDNEVGAASTFAAAKNFFNGPGEPPLRVSGDPATATSFKVATDADTIMWYKGQSPAVSAGNLGRLEISNTAVPVLPVLTPPTFTHEVKLAQQAPDSGDYGFQISGISANTASMTTTPPSGANSAVKVEFSDTVLTVPGEKIEFTLKEPPPSNVERTVALTAVNGKAGPGQFTIGANGATTAKNFSNALDAAMTGAAAAAEGNPRQSVTAQVDDSTRVNYGMQANESGFLSLVRTMAAMSVETYPPTTDPDQDKLNRSRFDAMAVRQQAAMSEAHNSEAGSIEIMTMELGVARGTLDNSAKRHTDYKAQLDNLLSDVETVSKEDVAMEILALQTRLQASYQTTSMVAKLSLVNFI
ncbi:MAG: hypothetical protein JWQ22_545 [Devosia sp.]|nr:hypothetical protein [Devosia sp.]